jgi:hypothetical protein
MLAFMNWGVRVGPSAETYFSAVKQDVTRTFTNVGPRPLAAKNLEENLKIAVKSSSQA